MFNLRDFFNIKCDLAGEAAAPGGEPSGQSADTSASSSSSPLLSGGQQSQPSDNPGGGQSAQPEPFLSELPKEGDADGWNAVYAKLGRPESAEGYQLPVPEGDTGEFAKTTSEWMHKAGLNKQQAQALATEWNSYQAQQAEAQQAAIQKQRESDLSSVKQDWGAQFDANRSVMEKAVNTFAPPEFIEMLDKSGLINSPVIANMFLKIGAAINEDQSVATKSSPNGGEKTLEQRLWPDMH